MSPSIVNTKYTINSFIISSKLPWGDGTEGGWYKRDTVSLLTHHKQLQVRRRSTREGRDKIKFTRQRRNISNHLDRMTTKMNIILAILALLMPCYLAAPRPSQDTLSCSDGSRSPLICSPAVSRASPLEGNQDLWGTMCGSRVVQQLAKSVCYNLSEASRSV